MPRAALQAAFPLLTSHLVTSGEFKYYIEADRYSALLPITSTDTRRCSCVLNNVKTQNVLRVFSSLLILYNNPSPSPSPPPASPFFPFIHLSQEWCHSLRLCAPAMSTPTPSCTWTWARTQGSCQGRMLRSENTTHLKQTTKKNNKQT